MRRDELIEFAHEHMSDVVKAFTTGLDNLRLQSVRPFLPNRHVALNAHDEATQRSKAINAAKLAKSSMIRASSALKKFAESMADGIEEFGLEDVTEPRDVRQLKEDLRVMHQEYTEQLAAAQTAYELSLGLCD